MFLRARKALGLYGEFSRHLIIPYICVDLNLDGPLTHTEYGCAPGFFIFIQETAHEWTLCPVNHMLIS